MNEKLKFVLGQVENNIGKGEKCWLPVFSPFPSMFSKAFISKVLESQDCVVRCLKNRFHWVIKIRNVL